MFQSPVIGILGGGQLGRMLIQSGIDLDLKFKVLDPDADAPCRHLSDFTHGKLTDHNTVIQFAESCDVVTVEIENVSVPALAELSRKGKKVFPPADALAIIQDKGRQKEFFRSHGIPTADFVLTANRAEVMNLSSMLPAVIKLRREGYDGRGVQVLRTSDEFTKAFDAPGVLERLIDIDKELSVIVARNASGAMEAFPPVEMVFKPEQNLVDFLLAPARIPSTISEKAIALARQVTESLEIVGLLAVEMFLDRTGNLLVNELAPRPHNSGHHTIEANQTSQFEQHLRAILNLPLGSTDLVSPAAMVNLLGEPGHTGPARYRGLEAVMEMPGVHIHLYGKRLTKPHRKMGHVTILDKNAESLRDKVNFVKNTLKVES